MLIQKNLNKIKNSKSDAEILLNIIEFQSEKFKNKTP